MDCKPAALRPVVGDPTWYRLHRAFQVVGLAVALSGFIVALTSFDLNELSTHGLVGTLAMTSGLLQALNGFSAAETDQFLDFLQRARANLSKGAGS